MRWRPTTEQKRALERIFATCRSPLPETLECLAASLGITTKQVRIYFQNRRLRRKDTATPNAPVQLLSPHTSSPTTFQIQVPQLAPISTPPQVLSAAVLGFIHHGFPVLDHPSFSPASPNVSYTTSGPPAKKPMLIKQSSNPRPGFTLAEAQQSITSALQLQLQLQHAQQYIGADNERSALFSRPSTAGIPMLARKPTFGPSSPLSAKAWIGLAPAHLMQAQFVAQAWPLLARPSPLRPAASLVSSGDNLNAYKPTPSVAFAAPPLPGHKYTSLFEGSLKSFSNLLGDKAAGTVKAVQPPAHITPRPSLRGNPPEQLLMQMVNEIDGLDCSDVEDMFQLLDHVENNQATAARDAAIASS
ncbi:homeobox domain-containing protein [Pavlovales sp. CCMP2436]|nr:homeobox domain-containing protein [Pavlovales sp. CCMP2436]